MRFNRRLKPTARIDMTNLIDVIYILVVFFLVTSVYRVAPGIALSLPGSTTTTSVPQGQIKVIMLSADEIWVNNDRATLQELSAHIKKYAEGRKASELNAMIEADKSLPYQAMITALDAFRANGIEGVALSTLPGGSQGEASAGAAGK